MRMSTLGKRKVAVSEPVAAALAKLLKDDPISRAIAGAVGRAWTHHAIGKRPRAVDEPFLYVAFKAGLKASALASVGWLLLDLANRSFETQSGDETERVPDALGDVDDVGRELVDAGLLEDIQLADADTGKADEDDEPTPEYQESDGEEVEDKTDPNDEASPNIIGEKLSPDDYHYKILIDRLDCVKETPGLGDDEPQWHVRGAAYWVNGEITQIRFESAEKQDVITGDVLSMIPPDRRVPQDIEHQILYSDGHLVCRNDGEAWFRLQDFRYVDFRIELYEIDYTDAFVEAFELLGDLFDTATAIGSMLNPLLAITELLSNIPDPNSQEARDAADTLRKIIERLKENALLGEYVETITEAELRAAQYTDQGSLQVAIEQKPSGNRFMARNRDGDLQYHYVMRLRYERKVLPPLER